MRTDVTAPHSVAAYVDANVILSYLLRQPPDMADAARTCFAAAERGDLSLLITPTTLAEVVWVLSSVYKIARTDVAAQLQALVMAQGIVAEAQQEMTLALSLYQDRNIDFADALLAAHSLLAGPPVIYSFDRHFDRVQSIRRIDPSRYHSTESPE